MTIQKVLIVDDSKTETMFLTDILQKNGYVVSSAENAEEAFKRLEEQKPDLILMDAVMPGFDGFSVVSGLMEVEPPLFVFVTAYSDHAIRAFEAQATDYLMKPVEQERLADTMERVRQRLAEKRGCSTTVAPAHSTGRMDHEKPTTWHSGRQTCRRSSARSPSCIEPSCAAHSALPCVHSTPLGRAVVPEV